jgi:ferredoxin
MEIVKVKLVYFSPTGTSKKIVEAIARGVGIKYIHVDLTLQDICKHSFEAKELALIAAPVYGGRIPFTAVKRLKKLETKDTPAVVVVVYGNRAYEDALIELRDMAVEIGFRPIAGAAFIGEHSYDTPETPIATGRPDMADLEKAEAFGRKVKTKLDKIIEIPELMVPGNKPYKERRKRRPRSPETDFGTCILCGMCGRVCPTGVVRVSDSVETDKENCISCTSCVKNCPTQSRHWNHERINQTAVWLHTNYSRRKEPETFL